ncbi:MAG: NUDIX hydrolase [Propionibacteriaceae bacterium]|nr:NUDIX hydrolase [Propionibacteriaceae bacterium]
MRDVREHWPITSHQVLAENRFAAFVEDKFTAPDGELLRRQYLLHPGSVAILALDEQGRVAVIDQYRHPVATRTVELPAGLLDIAGEDPLAAAQRELAEEARLAADNWRVLVDFYSSPGISQETARIYLAWGLRQVPLPEGFVVEGEEAHMSLAWLPLAELLAGINAGELENPAMILGCLSLQLALTSDKVSELRPGDAPWPMRSNKLEQDARLAALRHA